MGMLAKRYVLTGIFVQSFSLGMSSDEFKPIPSADQLNLSKKLEL